MTTRAIGDILPMAVGVAISPAPIIAAWVSVLKLVIGVLFLLIAAKQWRGVRRQAKKHRCRSGCRPSTRSRQCSAPKLIGDAIARFGS